MPDISGNLPIAKSCHTTGETIRKRRTAEERGTELFRRGVNSEMTAGFASSNYFLSGCLIECTKVRHPMSTESRNTVRDWPAFHKRFTEASQSLFVPGCWPLNRHLFLRQTFFIEGLLGTMFSYGAMLQVRFLFVCLFLIFPNRLVSARINAFKTNHCCCKRTYLCLGSIRVS